MGASFLRRLALSLAAIGVLVLPEPAAAGGGGYFLEFRGRPSENFGHSYVIARKVGRNGRGVASRMAGFGPMRGSSGIDTLFGVRGALRIYSEDRRIRPTQRFVVRVSRRAYIRAMAAIAYTSRRPGMFYLLDRNCNSFVGNVARAAGIRAPDADGIMPEDYVARLRALNIRAH